MAYPKPDKPGVWILVEVRTVRRARARKHRPNPDGWPRWTWIRVA